MKTFLAIVLLTFICANAAWAQTTPPPAGGLLDVGQAFSTVMQPYINAALQALLAAGLAWLAWWLKTKWGIDIDKQHQDTVQKWLTNQAGSLVADGAVTIQNGKIVVNQAVLNSHALQITQQIPDAAAYFAISPQLVASKIVDKLPQIPAVASMMAVNQPNVNPGSKFQP